MEASNSAKVSRASACIDWLSFSAARIRASTLVPASETSLISHLSLHKSSTALLIASRHCMCPARQLQHRLALCPGPMRIVIMVKAAFNRNTVDVVCALQGTS